MVRRVRPPGRDALPEVQAQRRAVSARASHVHDCRRCRPRMRSLLDEIDRLQGLAGELSRAAVRAVAWQPIETAPRDGTEVLAWQPTPEGGRVTVAGYDGPDGPWWDETGLRIAPTHWLPYPEPLK
jgi:hypothetical protein